MRRVCICENVHFRFIYTPSLMKNAPHWHTKFPRFLANPNYGVNFAPEKITYSICNDNKQF